MEQVKVSISDYMKDQINQRVESLGLSKSEYFRTLATLDAAVQKYQYLVTYINMLYNKINEIHEKLNIYATPIQEIPTIKLESVE